MGVLHLSLNLFLLLMIGLHVHLSLISITRCPRCGLSRYKVKVGQNDEIDEFTKEGPPAKVVWYLPIIPRLKRLFANADDAKNLRWHADNRKSDGILRHPTDSLQ